MHAECGERDKKIKIKKHAAGSSARFERAYAAGQSARSTHRVERVRRGSDFSLARSVDLVHVSMTCSRLSLVRFSRLPLHGPYGQRERDEETSSQCALGRLDLCLPSAVRFQCFRFFFPVPVRSVQRGHGQGRERRQPLCLFQIFWGLSPCRSSAGPTIVTTIVEGVIQ